MRTFTIIALAGLLAACHARNKRDDSMSETRAPETQRAEPGQYEARPAPLVDEPASPELRILSIVHVRNQEEINAGRLARERGSSDAATKLGARLVKDHTDADSDLMSLARSEGFNVLDPARVRAMLIAETGGTPTEDLANLRTLRGKEFDAEFGRMVLEVHAQLIAMIEQAQSRVQRPPVRDFLNKLLPALKEHEQMAKKLAGG